MKNLGKELQDQLKQVRLFGLDVDGVLTDGGVYILENGQEFRRFNIKDGLGLKRVMAIGINVVWISSGTNPSIYHRAKQLGVRDVHLGVADKFVLLSELCNQKGTDLIQVAFMGDDLTDLDVMRHVGMACAPADAVENIRQVAAYVSDAPGGYGAVREVCDLLVASQSSHENTSTP